MLFQAQARFAPLLRTELMHFAVWCAVVLTPSLTHQSTTVSFAVGGSSENKERTEVRNVDTY